MSLDIKVYVLTKDLHLVEVRRGKGDIFEYFKLYTEICEQLTGIAPTMDASK